MGSLAITSFWAFNNGLKFNWISWRTGRKSRNCKAMLKMYFCMLGIHPRYLPIWMVNWILSSELCSPWSVHPPTVCHPQKSLQWFVQWKRINGFEIQCPKWTMLFELINSLKTWLKTSLNVPLEITFIMSESPTPLDLWPWKEMTWFWLLLEAASLTWPIFMIWFCYRWWKVLLLLLLRAVDLGNGWVPIQLRLSFTDFISLSQHFNLTPGPPTYPID